MDPHLPFPAPRSHAEEIANIEAWRNSSRAAERTPERTPQHTPRAPRDFDTAARAAPIRPDSRPRQPAPEIRAAAIAIATVFASGILAALIALWVLA